MTTTDRPAFMTQFLELLDHITAPDLDELIAEVAEVKARLEPISERITSVLQNYENHLFWMVREVNERYPDLDGDADDGLHLFIRHAIGHNALWDLCQDVSDMVDPDGLVRPALHAQMDYVQLATAFSTSPPERPAAPGEVCICGNPASTVFVTTNHGEVPSCGVAHQAGAEENDQ